MDVDEPKMTAGDVATPTAQASSDPNIWLEDVHSSKALKWVEAENAKTAARLETDPRYEIYRKEALAIFTAQDRIASPEFRAGGIDNIWQDDEHQHGIWRHSSLAAYLAGRPDWHTLIDLDRLSKAEGRNWIWKGASCLQPDERYCLVHLSDGGGDAVEIREFDTTTREFIGDGFHFDRAKQSVDWIDRDTLIVARDWGGSELTEAGYPYVVKVLRRGQPLSAAHEVFRGDRKDAFIFPRVLHDPDGDVRAIMVERRIGFFESEVYLILGDKAVKLPLPKKTTYQAFVKGAVVFTIEEDWNGYKAGALVAYDLDAVRRHPASLAAHTKLILQPASNQTIDNVDGTRDSVVVQLLNNVTGVIEVYHRKGSAWRAKRLALPRKSSLVIKAASKTSNRLFVSSESFLEPTALWAADAQSGRVQLIAQLPARFDGSHHVVEQHWATSTDGTKVPYFLVRPKIMESDGSTPVLMYGYGGFQISKPPAYLPEMGKLWLERGGAYVIANIRGGGEFGPAWHQSALREHRQRAFDDFAAVARDLFNRRITSPRHLGIYGRSNGGVLTSVSMTQHPELFNAVVIESPLIDMLRYNHLSAGASWVSEYGNPDIPGDRAFIARYSAYQNLKPGVHYPEPYITTNTEDDRVHPGHARKFAARLSEIGAPYLYYENTFGGHANDADPELNARRWARHYVYLAQKLMD
ncbi:MAG: prolyl oligopeptidase family serine peptidase [Alphaproteobacteria bacterium]|nr:prolyl oligopeptidase family serine peptidase [Alphaproteobacteria bacterium]